MANSDEEELTAERTASSGDSEGERTIVEDLREQLGRPEDEAAERFLELEAELAADASPALPEGSVRRGYLVDAALVPVSEVPDGYPVEITGARALALSVELEGGREVPAYLDWPTDRAPDGDSTLGRLLAGLDVAPEQLGALYGQRVLATVIDGQYLLYVPEESPRGSGRDVYGVITSAVASIGTLAGFALSPGSFLFLAFVFTTFLLLPFFTYRDAWYLRTNSDWEGGPLFWATLALFPGINVLSTAAYLRQRSESTFLRS